MVWFIRDSLRSFDETEQSYGYEHLAKVVIKPNCETGNLEQFLKNWDDVLDSMPGAMKDEHLIHRQFYRSVVKHKLLQFHMNCYHARDVGHPDKCYAYLRKCVDDVILAASTLKNADERDQLLDIQLNKQVKPALPAPQQGEGEGGAKSKSGKRTEALAAAAAAAAVAAAKAASDALNTPAAAAQGQPKGKGKDGFPKEG